MAVVEVAIVGAGASGILVGIQLQKRLGIKSFTIFEKEVDLSGTWASNVYPGCACDVASHLYSYSFELNPDWSHAFSPQDEIHAYFKRVAIKYGVIQHIQFKTEVTSLIWNEEDNQWVVTVLDLISGQEHQVKAKYVFCCTGTLSRPRAPNIPGLSTFRGRSFHTAQWAQDEDLTNKNVAIIGSGASAVQVIAAIASKVKSLTVFQRSPNYLIPANQRRFSALEKWIFRYVPGVLRLKHFLSFYEHELRWYFLIQLSSLRALSNAMSENFRKSEIKDPVLLQKLTPDYPIGCRRLLVSDGFYAALQRPNVKLVTDHISHITETGVATDSEKFNADVLILATGFNVVEYLAPLKIIGTNNANLRDQWKDNSEAYFGILAPNFPNMFVIYGPSTNLGHNSILKMVEIQVEYSVKVIEMMRLQRAPSVQVRPAALQSYVNMINRDLKKTVWSTACGGWYENKSGRVVANWPSTVVAYGRFLQYPVWKDLDFKITKPVALWPWGRLYALSTKAFLVALLAVVIRWWLHRSK